MKMIEYSNKKGYQTTSVNNGIMNKRFDEMKALCGQICPRNYCGLILMIIAVVIITLGCVKGFAIF